jgi:hypothetical protein
MTRRKIRVYGCGLVGAMAYTAAAVAQAAPARVAAVAAKATTETTTTTTTTTAAVPAEPIAAPAPTPTAPTPDVAAAPVGSPPIAFAAPKIESANATIKLGLLLQPQFEAVGNADPALSGGSYNYFLRRARVLVGGTLFGKFEYFFETDSANLFKADPASGTKPTPGIVVQDAFGTFKAYDDFFKVDAGYMLTPGAHNALQGAGTLLGVDYFRNTFLHTDVFNSGGGSAGRDAGIEARGLVVDNHLEYRAGIFQGFRRPATMTEVAARNAFRFAARLQYNVFDAETGFFYGGTYLGQKKILSFGASLDLQDSYHHWAFDGFLDMPLGPGNLTVQANFAKWNGGAFIAALPNLTALMAEAGYLLDSIPVSPLLSFETLKVVNTPASEARFGLGVAYWPYGHNINLKAFYQRIEPKPDPAKGYNQFNLQWQLYFY